MICLNLPKAWLWISSWWLKLTEWYQTVSDNISWIDHNHHSSHWWWKIYQKHWLLMGKMEKPKLLKKEFSILWSKNISSLWKHTRNHSNLNQGKKFSWTIIMLKQQHQGQSLIEKICSWLKIFSNRKNRKFLKGLAVWLRVAGISLLVGLKILLILKPVKLMICSLLIWTLWWAWASNISCNWLPNLRDKVYG